MLNLPEKKLGASWDWTAGFSAYIGKSALGDNRRFESVKLQF